MLMKGAAGIHPGQVVTPLQDTTFTHTFTPQDNPEVSIKLMCFQDFWSKHITLREPQEEYANTKYPEKNLH